MAVPVGLKQNFITARKITGTLNIAYIRKHSTIENKAIFYDFHNNKQFLTG